MKNASNVIRHLIANCNGVCMLKVYLDFEQFL